MRTVRAITLHQPYASLIAEQVKSIETRGLPYPWRSAIGATIAIHAAARDPEHAFIGDWEVGRLDPGAPRRLWSTVVHDRPLDLPLGAVVATCTLRDVVPMDDLPFCSQGHGWHYDGCNRDNTIGYPKHACEDQRPFGDFAPGRWALLLDNVVRLREPVYDVGGFHRGLWTVPDVDVARIETQLTAA